MRRQDREELAHLAGAKLGLLRAMATPSVSVLVQTIGETVVRSVPLSDMLDSSSSAFISESASLSQSPLQSRVRSSIAASQTCFISL